MTDEAHMAHALGLGRRGLGRTWPNPAVGCVIVRDGMVLGRGWTQPGGRPHAETRALHGIDARGATAYVTLEPCAHHGHTPPCCDALIAAGVARVVTALTDPDPRVAGKGHAALRAAGITVSEHILADQARAANAGFLKRVTKGLPFVTLKLATSLDGRIAMASGESRWITDAQSRRAVHAMRLTHDAVLVGSGTARADDPDLTVRDIGASHQPLRIVIDSALNHSPQSRLGSTARQSPVWLIHCNAPPDRQSAWRATGATLLDCPSTKGHVDLAAAVRLLGAQGLTRILCEGGGTLAAALIRHQLVDEIALFSAGLLIGSEGQAALGTLGLTALQNAPRPTLQECRRLGPDTLSRWSLS